MENREVTRPILHRFDSVDDALENLHRRDSLEPPIRVLPPTLNRANRQTFLVPRELLTANLNSLIDYVEVRRSQLTLDDDVSRSWTEWTGRAQQLLQWALSAEYGGLDAEPELGDFSHEMGVFRDWIMELQNPEMDAVFVSIIPRDRPDLEFCCWFSSADLLQVLDPEGVFEQGLVLDIYPTNLENILADSLAEYEEGWEG